ncbi:MULTISPECIES: hypothetical protein [Rhodococcus]|uniref:hypothetical protein n=1 Tax=Rhodococcus TaxID=1827 RepID=UPI001E2F7F9F|nr:hypothetical protein [Rhodococcus pyridinivorans]MCD2116814.1 hypothetical protein [Rhodococcus pyridinivorans]MCZ4625978.1 hypothetical protein [Rhodococcus pyridinivorans]MCZ4646933.1 hypothetical protein [Rhodococcus pyridinivorans]MDJ0480285.1 hypothetical protein [Rhodococcus pyridinivorans]MDV7253036.1 hypothetical protein [Rhodococcus pyridinivorans]
MTSPGTQPASKRLVTEERANATYAPVSVADDVEALGGEVAGKLDQAEADARYVPSVDSRVPAENLPALFRTTDSQPFRADSIWNTPIGTEAVFEDASAAPTASLLAATPVINDTLNGYGFYLNIARPTDPLGTGTYQGENGPVSFTHRIPYDPVISAGTDGSMRIIDGRFAYDYWKTTKVDDVTYTAQFITRTDLLGTGQNAGTRAARFPTSGGLIRSHELSKCYIPHALCISIPPSSLKRGFEWPAAAEDAAGVIYSGEVPMGSFLAIPPSVDINTLGLSQEGYALAECLQNYGMYVGDASGSAAISVDGEAAVVMRSALDRMRADWSSKIFPQVRRVTNVGTTAGGPGPRRVPASGPVAIRSDYQETILDVLMTQQRANSGMMQTSENGATDVDPLVSTNAGSGGRSLPWTGWAQQYRISNKAIKRVAAPDGQTRLLLLDPGMRNVRIEVTIEAMHASGWAYLVAAAEGSANHFRHAFASQGASQLQKVTGGGGGIILPGTSRPNGTVGAFKRIGLMIYGARIFGLLDGEIISEALDPANQGFRLCGLYFPSDTNIAVRDLTVRSVPRLFRKPLPEV